MPSLYNKPIFRDRRRELRTKQTRPEELLWYRLRNNQLDGQHFFRQYSAGPYILDFYCPKLRLAIEVDGEKHAEEEAILYDKERGLYLTGLDIKTIRFWNKEVMGDMDTVLKRIRKAINSPDPSYLKSGVTNPMDKDLAGLHTRLLEHCIVLCRHQKPH
jgi:very-short-patch-repair endonuclease